MKKFYIVGILIMVMLVFVACTKDQTKAQDAKKSIEETLKGYEKEVTDLIENEVVTEENIEKLNEKLDELINELEDEEILEKAKEKSEDLLEKIKEKAAEQKENEAKLDELVKELEDKE